MRTALVAARLLVAWGLLASGCAAVPATAPHERLVVERRVVLAETIAETSGLAFHSGRLWTHNDSGDGPYLYAFDSVSGEVLARRTLQDAINFDWEALAQDEHFLHVFDCGNNGGRRQWMQIYSLRWDDLVSHDERPVRSRLTEFSFADADSSGGFNRHNHDCEAATVVDGELWVFSKNWQDRQTRLYRLSVDGGRQALSPQAAYPVEGLITAADYDPDRRQLVLLGYELKRFSVSAFIWLMPVVQGEPDWSRARRHSISPAGQWEAVRWHKDGLWLTRESSLLGQSILGFVPLP